MKRFLLLPIMILVLLAACKKEQEQEPATRVNIDVMRQSKSSSGQITAHPTSAIIHIWAADNCEYDVEASPDISVGAAFDKTSNSYKTMKYGAIGSSMNEKVKPGRYFVYVLLPKSSSKGSLAHSYTYFEVKQGQTLSLTKTFSYDVETGEFENWEENKISE